MDVGENKKEVRGDFMETEVAEVEVEHGDGDGDGDGHADEDEVVREIDVYFAPSIDPETQLYLFQYPLRKPYELDERCQEVRVKPKSAEVEVDLAIDVDSNIYDANADPELQMDKQTLALSWKPPPKVNRCTVGILTGNKLHLNSIHAVVQLRPSLRHIDQKESKKRTDVGNSGEDMMKLEEQQQGKPSGSGISKTQKAPEPTEDGEEEWVPLKYHSVSSDMATGYLKKMVAREGSEVYFSMSPNDYLNSLVTSTFDDSLSSKGPLRSGSTSRNVMPGEVREAIKKALQKLFKSTRTCSFQQIIPRLRDMLVSETARSRGSATEVLAAVDAYPNELQEIISEVAENVHGICVPISSPDNKDYDDLRRVVIDLFLAEGPNAMLKKDMIVKTAKLRGQVINDAAYGKVMKELCVSQGCRWVLRIDD